MPHSHHSHSGEFCRHAKSALEEVVSEAIRLGFTSYGLTEHCPRYRPQDLYPEESDLSPDDLSKTYGAFLAAATSLRQRVGERIALLIGIESDYITPQDLEGTKRLYKEHKAIDYIVGSVHHVNEVPIDFDHATYLQAVRSCSSDPAYDAETEWTPRAAALEAFFCAYLDAQYEMLLALQPAVVGHFDLCLLYTPSVRLSDYPRAWAKACRNVQHAVSYGALFEANSAALRKGWQGSYPSPDVLKLIRTSGGRLCLSDDSHGVQQVGLNYTRMRDYLLRAGVSEVWTLVRSDKSNAGDESVGANMRVRARRVKDWTEHAFWAMMERENKVTE